MSSLTYLSKEHCFSCEPHECNKKHEQQKSSHFVSVFFVVLIFRACMKVKSPESSLRCCDELHHIYLFIAPSTFCAIFSGKNITFVKCIHYQNIHGGHVIICGLNWRLKKRVGRNVMYIPRKGHGTWLWGPPT